MIDINYEELQKLSGEELLQLTIDNGNKLLAERNEIIEEKKELEDLLALSDKELEDAISSGNSIIIAIERYRNNHIKKRIDAVNEVLEKTELSASIAKAINRKILISKLLGGEK
jgi:hypothetical protein